MGRARSRVSERVARDDRATHADAPRTRVLCVINDLAIGGAERALLAQAASLDPARFEVHVASLELVPGGRLTAAFRDTGLTVHVLRAAGEPAIAAGLRLFALVGRLKPDVVHTHLAAAGIAGRIAARLRGVRCIASTLHNVSDWQERRRHPLRLLDRATLALATHVCAVSDAVHAACVRVAPQLASRTRTLLNGVELDRFAVTPDRRAAARARLGLAPVDFVVVTVARLERCKGLDTLLRAAAAAAPRVPSLQVVVAGNGSEMNRLQALADELGIGGSTTFTGMCDDVPAILAAADVFAMPSRTEGLGVAAIESLAAGLPVLASHVGGLPEVVEDGACGRLLAPNDPAAWAAAIVDAAADPAKLARWRAAATARARRFSIAATTSALATMYGAPAASVEQERQAA